MLLLSQMWSAHLFYHMLLQLLHSVLTTTTYDDSQAGKNRKLAENVLGV